MAVPKKRELKTVKIEDSAEGGEVQVITSMRAEDVDAIQRHQKTNSETTATMLAVIKSWNLTNETGTPLEINASNISKHLEMTDVARILKESGIEEYIKKNFPHALATAQATN